ncbi:MAG: tetratricopeptide repeat protein [Nonlabens sp.]
MRIYFVLFVCLLFSTVLAAQKMRLAENYVDQGEYAKALKIYKESYNANKRSTKSLFNLIEVYHQLENYTAVDSLLDQAVILLPRNKELLVERGYNLGLQGMTVQADSLYDLAIKSLDSLPQYSYQIGARFEKRTLLDQAVATYERGSKLMPNRNFDYQLSRLYGEQGNFEKLFDSTVGLIETNSSYRARAQAIFSRYITDDASSEINLALRKVLLLRLRENPDLLYNHLLSWLYVQQKDFKKAFVQEKAIYRRTQENMLDLQYLASDAVEEKDIEAALEILDYVIQESPVQGVRYEAQLMKINIRADIATLEQYPSVKSDYEQILEQYGSGSDTYKAQLDYARFMAFSLNESDAAILLLSKLEELKLSTIQRANVKMLLADILVSQEQFNRALILYSQVQNDVPNYELAQEAQFKVARTSYFQGDFKWSLTQLKVLRAAASKLIANDAMELSLVISDHSIEDTTMVALSALAKAELKQYQNKNLEAIELFNKLLLNHKGDPIEDEALLSQAQLYQKVGKVQMAVNNYRRVVNDYGEGSLADDALYFLGLLYEETLAMPAKAQECFQAIIFNHADSIHLIDARRRFRRLRGDDV